MQERGRRGGKAQAAGATVCLSTPAGRPAGTGLGSRLQPTAAVHLHPAANTSISVPFSLHLSLWCSSTPALLYFSLLPSPAPPREPRSIHPHPQAKPSSPGSSCSRSGVWSRIRLRGCGLRPARTDWRGGALGRPASAAQPRPSTHGRGEAQTQPPVLDAFACVTHPGPAQGLLMLSKVPLKGPFSPKGILKSKPEVPASMQLTPTLPILDKAAPLAGTSRNGRTTG